jgi:hypothetical protein
LSNPWIEELWRTLSIAAASLFVGWLFDAIALALLVGLGVYAAWHMRQVYRLEVWLRHGKRFPSSRGARHLGRHLPDDLPAPAAQP